MRSCLMLIPNWRKVAKRAWSVRLMLLASILTGGEAILPLVGSSIERGPFALVTFIVVMGALLARFLAQQALHDD